MKDTSTEFKDSDKAIKLRKELSEDLRNVIIKDKYKNLSVFFTILDDESGAYGWGGNWCPVCAVTAMTRAIILYGVAHIEEQKSPEEIMNDNLKNLEIPSDKKKLN